jgi:hypothetical protein
MIASVNPVRVLPVEIVRASHHAIPVEVHAATSQSLWPAIITAAATVALAVLAYRQITAGQAQIKEQADAALALARETREAAERQWQPRVFAHAWHGPVRGDGDNAAPDEMAVRYYLSNEGTGPAFNVEHGIDVAGTPHTWENRQWRTMRAGEAIPPIPDPIRQPVPDSPLVIGVRLTDWDEDITYWTRFENLLGERFEVRNPPDATTPAEFRRVP